MDNLEEQFRSKIFSFSFQVVPFVIMEFTGTDTLFEQMFGEDDSVSPYVKEVIMLILIHDPDHDLATNTRTSTFECFKIAVNNAIRIVFDRGYCPGYFLKFCARLCFLAFVLLIRDIENAPAYVSLSLNLLLHRYHINNQFTEDSWSELDEEAKGVIEMCKIHEPEEVIKAMGIVRFTQRN